MKLLRAFKQNKIMTISILILSIFVLWSLLGFFGSRVEQAEYRVIERRDGYEIREYGAHIVAQTTVNGVRREALNQGFRIIAGYIFGGNSTKKSIAMTAPVLAQSTSEKIAMTAPVLAQTEGSTTIIAFGMPRAYSLETLPIPNDSRVQLVEVPKKRFAVLRFSGLRTDDRVTAMEKKLLEVLTRDGVKTIGAPAYAGYNSPWTPPWMTRNEVLEELAT